MSCPSAGTPAGNADGHISAKRPDMTPDEFLEAVSATDFIGTANNLQAGYFTAVMSRPQIRLLQVGPAYPGEARNALAAVFASTADVTSGDGRGASVGSVAASGAGMSAAVAGATSVRATIPSSG